MIRTFEYGTGQKLHFKKHPRYGSWSVNFDKGGSSPALEGQFYSFRELYDKTDYYLQNREKNKTSIGQELTNA